jgi:hypothetical protein
MNICNIKCVFLFISLFSVCACKRSDQLSDINTFNGPPTLYIFVTDSNGMDLLNPANPKAFYQYNIRRYVVDNGILHEQLDVTGQKIIMGIVNRDTIFYLNLWCAPYTIIEWSKEDRDTIQHIDPANGYSKEIYLFNGKPIQFNVPPYHGSEFRIVK